MTLSRAVWVSNPGFYGGGDGQIDQLPAQFGSDWVAVIEAIILQHALRLRSLMERYPTLRVTIVTGEDSHDHTEVEFRSGLSGHFSAFDSTRVQQTTKRKRSRR